MSKTLGLEISVLMSHSISDEAWDQLAIKEWMIVQDEHWDRLGHTHGMLMLHVEHLADLQQSESVDDLGAEILQQFVDVEMPRFSPADQDLLDSLVDSINCFNGVNGTAKDEYTELAERGSLLIELQKSVLPIEGYNMKLSLTQEQIVGWWDRLIEGASKLGVARALSQKYKLGLA
jgi:hypothetical protein